MPKRDPATLNWKVWTDSLPPHNRPILAFFPAYGILTIEYSMQAGGSWRCVVTGTLFLDNFPTHWAEQPAFPKV